MLIGSISHCLDYVQNDLQNKIKTQEKLLIPATHPFIV